MTFVAFLPLILSLAIYFVPVWLLRPKAEPDRETRFVASRATSAATIRNASIAHGLRFAAFGPLFVLGARGDFWPVLIAAAALGAGLFLLYLLRQPITAFLAGALKDGRSITVHAFIAEQHGKDRRVLMLAAVITLVALTALMAVECFALASFLKLALGNDIVARAMTFGALLLALLYAFPAGHSGAMQSAQLQLGVMFLALFAATALLVYFHATELTPLPAHALFGILLAAAYGVALMIYRSSRYLDTAPVANARNARWLSLFGKILNPVTSVFVVLVVVLALMDFFVTGFSAVAGAAVTTLSADTSLSPWALIALALLPLFYPLADSVNWQRLAAAERSQSKDGKRWRGGLRSFMRIYALESALLWIFMAAFGAIAVAATGIPADAKAMQSFMQQLVGGDNPLGGMVLSLLMVTVFAIALPALSAAFSAALCTIGYDLMPAKRQSESKSPRLFFLAVIVALGLADVAIRMDAAGTTFLALVFALGSPVLAFAPLILGPASGKRISADQALVVLGLGAACTVGGIVGYAATGSDAWLWASVPACLAASGIAFAIFVCLQGSRIR